MAETLLEVRGLSKSFGGVVATAPSIAGRFMP